ncbi:MAG TPA: hypothetical protein VI410_11180 [Anaerolineales bacterium]|nr:hypothetical protein [Anaerolineales bacterium]
MRYIVTVRGKLKGSKAAAQKVHDATVAAISPKGRSMGSTAHQPFLNTQDEGEFLAVDSWDNLEGIQQLFSDPNLAAEFAKLFEGQPEVTIWAQSGWMEY